MLLPEMQPQVFSGSSFHRRSPHSFFDILCCVLPHFSSITAVASPIKTCPLPLGGVIPAPTTSPPASCFLHSHPRLAQFRRHCGRTTERAGATKRRSRGRTRTQSEGENRGNTTMHLRITSGRSSAEHGGHTLRRAMGIHFLECNNH